MAHVLVVRAGALGDFVLTLPVVRALLDRGDRVEVACAPRFAPLLPPGVPVLDVGGPAMAWAFGGAPHPAAARWARAYAFSDSTAARLREAGVAEVLAVAAHPTGPAVAHFAQHVGEVAPPEIQGEAHPAPFVVLAPGSGGLDKRKPLAFWLAVEAGLRARGVPTRWIAGPVEAEEAWPVPAESPGLPALLRLAADCRAWVGPDAGPQHVAAAARRGAGRAPADVHVVFGPTDPRVWAPPGATIHAWNVPPAELVAGLTGVLTTP